MRSITAVVSTVRVAAAGSGLLVAAVFLLPFPYTVSAAQELSLPPQQEYANEFPTPASERFPDEPVVELGEVDRIETTGDFDSDVTDAAPISSLIQSESAESRRREETYEPEEGVETFKPPVFPPLEVPPLDDSAYEKAPQEPSEYEPTTLSARPRREVRPGRPTTRFNVGVALTESALNEIAADAREEASGVCDRILGASVTGSQRTTTRTRIDCVSSYETARMNVVLESLTSSYTVGYRPDATVTTEGCHRADLIKPVFFDGFKMTTRRPSGFVRGNNTNRNVMTPLTGVPLIGPMANQIARQQTEASKPVAESIAAQRLTQRVVPEFNRTVDTQLARGNIQLSQSLQPLLRKLTLMPDALRTSTSETELRLRMRYGEDAVVETPGRRINGKKGAVLIHESAVNQLLAKLQLGGTEISDRQLSRLTSGLNPSGTGAPLFDADAGTTEPQLYSIVFANQDPVRVRFDNNDAEVVLRLSIRPVIGEMIPVQEIRLPIAVSLEGEEMVISSRNPRVLPANGSLPTNRQTLIEQQVAAKLQPVRLPRAQTVAVGASKSIRVRLAGIEANNGWLLLAVD